MKLSLNTLRNRVRSGPTAMTAQGQVLGKTTEKGRINLFHGVPFAAPPVGDLRWRAPQPAPERHEILSCLKAGPMPYQRGEFELFLGALIAGVGIPKAKQRAMLSLMKLAPQNESEDCLTLSVRAPVGASNLPVMVWIHGGDQTDGSASEFFYASNVLPERGCVLVSIEYRLGLFGFYGHPDLALESEDGVSGNYGLLDQIAALEWVRDNIASFGGDPEQVTIFGESAGGQGVLNLMTSPKARGLFHAAVAQSPSDTGRWAHLRKPFLSFSPVEDAGVEFADLVVGPEQGQIDRMRELPADELYEHYRANRAIGRHFYPAVDGKVLPTTPMTAFSNQNQAPVPLMIGHNADEGTLMSVGSHPAGLEFGYGPGPSVSSSEVEAALLVSYGSSEVVEDVLGLYPGILDSDEGAVSDHVGDSDFVIHVDHASRMHAEAGHRTYRYLFQAVPPSQDQKVGAFHAAEIPYLFDKPLPMLPVADDAHLLSRAMGDHWFAFAATHNPDFPGRESWPTFDSQNPKHMVFDRPKSRVEDCEDRPAMPIMRSRLERLNALSLASETIDVREGVQDESTPVA